MVGSNITPQNRLVSWGLHPLYKLLSRVLSIWCGTWIFPNTSPHAHHSLGLVRESVGDPWIRQALIPCWHWATCYQVSAIGPPTIYVHEPSSIVLVVRGCVKSPTSNRRWSYNVFISGSNHHLTSRFRKDELGHKFQKNQSILLWYFIFLY